MIVLRRFVRDHRRSTAWWSLGFVGLVALTVSFYPGIRNQASLDEIVRNLPPAARSLIGLQEGVSITSPPGYMQGRLFSNLLPLLLLIFGIGIGSRSIGGSEEAGTLELLLSNPVGRTSLFAQRYAGSVLLLCWVGVVFVAALVAMAPGVGLLEGVSPARLILACASAVCLALLHMSLATAAGCVFGRRAPAVAVATVVAVGGYLSNGLLASANVTGVALNVLPWHWYLRRNMLMGPPPLEAVLAPIVLSGVLAVAGGRIFAKRDLR